jgi:hypothetical protein
MEIACCICAELATVELPACGHAFCDECLTRWSSGPVDVTNGCPAVCQRAASAGRAGTDVAVPAAEPSVEPSAPNLGVGERLDALGSDHRWAKAQIVATEGTRVRVHFSGFAARFDEWIQTHAGESPRLSVLGTMTATKRQRRVQAAVAKGSDRRHKPSDTQTAVEAASSEQPALKRRRKSHAVKTSEFRGVCWNNKLHKWVVQIQCNGERQNLGCFGDEQQAARAFDTAARRLRGDGAHGGRAGKNFYRLNFPTTNEVKNAKARGVLLTKEEKAAAVANKLHASEYVGVSLNTARCQWSATICHAGMQTKLGHFDDEHVAARAVDTAARRLRGDDAHGGRPPHGRSWYRLNFPTEGEVKRAKARGALLTKEDKAAANAAWQGQGPSEYRGVNRGSNRKWGASIQHEAKQQHLGVFKDEREAALAVDAAARKLRGADAHGGRSGRNWYRLNFPTQREAARAKALGMP